MLKVSILLAVHNGSEYLDQAIYSVINQTYSNWELIVVENGSTDNTLEISTKWQTVDSRIKVFSLELKGKNQAYNFAYTKCNSDFICFLAADDILTPDNLEVRLEPFSANSDLTHTTCLLKTFSITKKFDGIIFPKNPTKPNFSGGSIFFRSQIADSIFPIPEILPNEDTWTSLHLRAFGKSLHLPLVLYNYRIHSKNSYGYGIDFDLKRTKFLMRMHAFDLFNDKFKKETSNFLEYTRIFSKGLEFCRNFKIKKILCLNLPIADKLLLIYYSSKFLFSLRQFLFKWFSGIL